MTASPKSWAGEIRRGRGREKDLLPVLYYMQMSYMDAVHKKAALLMSFVLAAATAFFSPAPAFPSAGEPLQGSRSLLETYHRVEAGLADSGFGFPLRLESSEKEGRLHVDVYGIFDHPFSAVAGVLKDPGAWCDIASLHPNVKACTYTRLPGAWHLTFYTSRKAVQALDDARPFNYVYRTAEQRQDYLAVDLTAEKGPFGTRDHRMRFEALPLPGERTFVHVSYAYSHGFALSLAAKTYFALLVRDRGGFTVSGTDGNGHPVYVRGPRGAVERNVVRYYFAIQSFMDTLNSPEESRFRIRISKWYDLTDRYRKQLYDLEKKDYLTIKTEERKNQEMLQRKVAVNLP